MYSGSAYIFIGMCMCICSPSFQTLLCIITDTWTIEYEEKNFLLWIWIFLDVFPSTHTGGLNYDLTEGDVLAVFSQWVQYSIYTQIGATVCNLFWEIHAISVLDEKSLKLFLGTDKFE